MRQDDSTITHFMDKETKAKKLSDMSRVIDCREQSKTRALTFYLQVPNSEPVFDSKRSARLGTLTRSWKYGVLSLPHWCECNCLFAHKREKSEPP